MKPLHDNSAQSSRVADPIHIENPDVMIVHTEIDNLLFRCVPSDTASRHMSVSICSCGVADFCAPTCMFHSISTVLKTYLRVIGVIVAYFKKHINCNQRKHRVRGELTWCDKSNVTPSAPPRRTRTLHFPFYFIMRILPARSLRPVRQD